MKRRALLSLLLYFAIAYIGGLAIRASGSSLSILTSLSPPLLMVLNAISILAGLPFSIFFDLLLFRMYGVQYFFCWPFVVAAISALQVALLRGLGEEELVAGMLSRRLRISGKLEKVSSLLENRINSSLIILFIRAVPILPFVVGSVAIAALSARLAYVISLSAIGSYFYYLLFYVGFRLGFAADSF